jgi:secondary thiamine-phosphate synthase enzyme
MSRLPQLSSDNAFSLVVPVAGSAGGVLYRRRVHSEQLRIRTGDREVVHDLTASCAEVIARSGVDEGLLNVWVPHATAGLAVIETGAGSDDDLLAALRGLLPPTGPPGGHGWRHRHGSPGHGRDHVLPGLIAPSMTIPVLGGSMALGTWQSVCLVDSNVDNPVRTVRVSVLAG